MKVLVHYHGTDYEIKDVSKAMLIKEFRKYVQDATTVEPKKQTLMFGGKIFQDDCDLCDYRVENGCTIHLLSRQAQPVASKQEEDICKKCKNNAKKCKVIICYKNL